MLRVTQIRLPADHGPEELLKKTASKLRLPVPAIRDFSIERRAIDARKKPQISYVYTMLETERRLERQIGRNRNYER